MVERLTSDSVNDPLDYIFTVDIFNEGVDLPEAVKKPILIVY